MLKLKIIFTTILFLLFFSSSAMAEMRSINGEKVNLRTGPGDEHNVKWEYGNGYPVKILSHKGNWLQVQDFENDKGWIHSSRLSKESHVIVKVNKGKNKQINIRSGPGTKYKIVGKAYYGVVFKKTKQQQGWINVKHESGLDGWIESKLLWGW